MDWSKDRLIVQRVKHGKLPAPYEADCDAADEYEQSSLSPARSEIAKPVRVFSKASPTVKVDKAGMPTSSASLRHLIALAQSMQTADDMDKQSEAVDAEKQLRQKHTVGADRDQERSGTGVAAVAARHGRSHVDRGQDGEQGALVEVHRQSRGHAGAGRGSKTEREKKRERKIVERNGQREKRKGQGERKGFLQLLGQPWNHWLG